MSLTTAVLFLVVAVAAVPVGLAVLRRPPTGILILAALAPFDGLLFIIPHPPVFEGWKEALVLLIVASAWRQRQYRDHHHGPGFTGHRRPLPSWIWPMLALLAVGTLSAVLNPGVASVIGLKIGFFYLLVPFAIWWVPLDDREQDRLITILMATSIIVALVGIGQQIAGPEALVALGYDYNSNVRFASGLLRSFSTFNQPFAYALYVMMALLVGIAVALEDRRRLRNAVFLALAPVLMIGMVTAVVRAALLGFAIGILWLFLQRYRILAHAMVPVVVVALLLPASVVGAFLSPTSLIQRSTGWTQTVFEQGIEPFGQGLGSVGSAAELVEDSRSNSQIEFPTGLDSKRYQPDNYYVKTLVELGPIGAWLLLWALLSGVRHARAATLRPRPGWGGLAAGISAAMVGAMAAALVSSYWEIFPVDLFYWMLLGLVPSLIQEQSTASSVTGAKPTTSSPAPAP